MPGHLHIVTLRDGEFDRRYLLAVLAKVWAERGVRVTVGPRVDARADLGILHVDRTHIDMALAEQTCRGQPLLNSRVLDISKRAVSRNLLRPGDTWSGPVIVKTDVNAFGGPERADLPRFGLRRLRSHLVGYLSWRLVRELPRRSYPILSSMAAVPPWVWSRKDLVVERFLPDCEGELYSIRSWIFLGQEEFGVRLFARDPMVKVKYMTHFDYLYEVPEVLRQRRAEMGFDFGKFDYVLHEGSVILLDANRTPSIRAGTEPSPNLMRLASALDGWMPSVF